MDFGIVAVPARIANLAFRLALPRDWNFHDLPPEEVDFSTPANFFPLFIASAPWAAIVLTVAARPAFENGTLQDWALFLLDSQQIRPTAFSPTNLGDLRALTGIGLQQQDDTTLQVHFAFLEDGGRLVHIGLMAPEALSASTHEVWSTALANFSIDEPQGQTAEIGSGLGFMPQSPDPTPDPAPQPTPDPAPQPTPEPPPPPTPNFSPSDFGYYSKSSTPESFDPEHPTNANLRDRAVGLVPNVLDTNSDARVALLGAGAIRARIQVAFGWHVIDDGSRTIILDPAGLIQISLNIIPTHGRDLEAILDSLQSEAEISYPNPTFQRYKKTGVTTLHIRGIEINNEPLEQVHHLVPWADESAILRARVTADIESISYASDYAALILRSADFGPLQQSSPDSDRPAWYREAQRLERENRLEEAERVIRDAIPSLHFAIATAGLYRDRWQRLLHTNPAAAAEARQQASEWAYAYASYATSGGEGAALSYERDQFLKTLGPDPE